MCVLRQFSVSYAAAFIPRSCGALAISRGSLFKSAYERDWLFAQEGVSQYISALTNDTNTIETTYLDKVFLTIAEVLSCVVAVVFCSPKCPFGDYGNRSSFYSTHGDP